MSSICELTKGLSSEETKRLLLQLTPVVKARKALMDFVLITVPKNEKTLKEIEAKRGPLLQSDKQEDKAELEELNRQLQAIRKVIAGHFEIRVALSTTLRKAKETFARHY